MNHQTQPSRIRRGLMLTVGLFSSVVTLAVGAQVASAHHADIVASVNCAGIVSWTSSSWNTGTQGANNKIEVGYGTDADNDGNLDDNNDSSIDAGENPVVLTTGKFLTHKPGSPNTVDSFSGSFAWPDDTQTSIIVYTIPRTTWGNGTTSSPLAQTIVNKPTDCPSGTPSATASVACGDGSGTVSGLLTVGPGFAPVTFTIDLPGEMADQVFTVQSGGSQPFSIPGVANGDVSITAPGMTTVTTTVSCIPGTPSAVVVTPTCTSATTATVDVTFSVTGGNMPVSFSGPSPIGDFSLAAGQSKTVSFTNVPMGVFTVNYTADGVAKSASTTGPIVCETTGTGSATISYRCENNTGSVIITLIHLGGDTPVDFVVNGTTQTLAKGETRDITVTGIANGPYSTPVVVAGVTQVLSVSVEACGLALAEPPVVVPPAVVPPVVIVAPAVVPAAIVEPPALTPPPVRQLPATGGRDVGNMITIGTVLLGLGGLLVFTGRRRARRL